MSEKQIFTQVSFTIHSRACKGPDVYSRDNLHAFGCYIDTSKLTAADLPLYIKDLDITITELHPVDSK